MARWFSNHRHESSDASRKNEEKRRRKIIETNRSFSMVSREHKREALQEKLQLLRSITRSEARTDSSIVLDASNYIKDLKHKVERLNEDIASAESSVTRVCRPRVTVETLEKGFMVNVHSGQSCPGLLVSVLATFERLGLNVLEARVSCGDNFNFQAFGGENEEDEDFVDAQMVKRAIVDAIKNWSESI